MIERWKKALSSSSPLRSSSSTASSMSSSSSTTCSVTAPSKPATSNIAAKKMKNRKTSTSPLLPSGVFSYRSRLPTWLCHIPLSPKAAIGMASATPLCFPRPKFFAQVVTALKYIELVPMPTKTNASTTIPNGHPCPPAAAGGPWWYVNAARRYPTPNVVPEKSESGRGLYRSQRKPNSGTGRYIETSAAIETILT